MRWHSPVWQSTAQHHTICQTQILKVQWWLQAFKDGDIRFLICTDVAARGIDIAGLPFVINMTLPDRSEDYIHRVGRVGELIYVHTLVSPINYITFVPL